MKLSTKLLLILALFGPNIKNITANANATVPASQAPANEIDLALFNWLQALDPQNSDLIGLIKEHFETDSQDVINFIAEQCDHVNLACAVFKQHFTNEEILEIIRFHNSEVGRKFGATFPAVMQDYKKALDSKIEAIKSAIVAYAKKQQEEQN